MNILISFAVLSGLLLLGTLIRAKVPFIQSIFLPASVIGGFIGLLLGPIVWGGNAPLPIPEAWLDIYALLPGILIVPVVASVPLGMRFAAKHKSGDVQYTPQGKKKMSTGTNMLILFFILVIISQGQQLMGLVVRFFSDKAGIFDPYTTFGIEAGAGFSGGHGTAGVIGSILQSMNQSYWELAQGVTTTTATLGIVGGILVGIVVINFAARRGHTNILTKPGDIPREERVGVQTDTSKQKSFGRETTLGSSIDVLAFHMALILGGSGVAYAVQQLVQYFDVPLITQVPIWAYAILVMYVIWGLMVVLKIDWMVDSAIKSKIASLFTDYAVVAAIVSLPLQAVLSYIVPILIMVTIVGALTLLGAYWLGKKLFDDFWFEKSIAMFGTSTGVFISGLLLLKMCDPEFESPVLSEYSIGYSFNLVLGFIMFPIVFGLLINSGLWATVLLLFGVCLAAVIGIVVVKLFNRKKAGTA